ncbi:phosphomannomutase/phosphoglucomutase [Clostridium sp. JN-1]|uniref:phosphomannomutase/phosphoglucomutase n=1 Tax=Clostridium sp. JN-1 TaxID=2483110 RepID=UPI000F0BBA6C|nr:phosphomannomutase/phosphoglucomutase [Clostridium sp. JN-1]
MLNQLKVLQNGTDIRGIAIDHEDKKANLTFESVKSISCGFVKWLGEKMNVNSSELKIAVGMDSRLSGPKIKDSVIQELINLGCSVYDCKMCTTPAMFMTTILKGCECDGAIMITASHLPYYYNGMKFFTKEGGCEKEDITNIISKSSVQKYGKLQNKGKVYKIDFISEYSNLLVNMIRKGVSSSQNYDKPMSGFKIVVDAGNGAGGFFAHKVLEVLGADITQSQFIEPDGRFPNHIPNPESEEAMESIKNAVLKSNADLGIIFDADVDRAAIVDSSGTEINKNTLIALISSIILEEHPGTTVVTDSVTSIGLSEFISELGGIHHRFKRGYKNVINEAKRLNDEGKECYLAIETSGHAALKQNYFLDDGAYLVSKILIKMAKLNFEGKNIHSLIEKLKVPVESSEHRINIKSDSFQKVGKSVLQELKGYAQEMEGWSIVPNNYEGIRVNCDKSSGNGWFLLRMSLHEPVLVFNVESDSNGGTKIAADNLKPLLCKYKELDI